MQDRFADEFDRFYAESLSGGVRIPDPSQPEQPPDRGITSVELIEAGLHQAAGGDNAGQTGGELYVKGPSADRRWSNASSYVSSRSRSSSSGSSHRGLSIPERVAVTREGLVEQIIEKWRATTDEHHLGDAMSGGKIIITDDENVSRFHDMTSSGSSTTSGSRPRASTFSGRSSRSPHRQNGDVPDLGDGDGGSEQSRPRTYSANMAALPFSGPDSSSRRSSGGQIFHFDVERRPSIAGRLLSFLGARPEPKRCEIAIRQLTPQEANNLPASAEIKSMELLLLGEEGVGKKEIIRSLLGAAAAPAAATGFDRARLPSIDSEVSWDETTCVVTRSFLEIDEEIVAFTARSAANEEDAERSLVLGLPDVVLGVYSVADPMTVTAARSLLSYVAQRTPKRTALCLVANKADLSGIASGGASATRELSGGSVNRSSGRAAAKSVGASWIETSAVISLNIRTLLAALLQHWIQYNNASTIPEEPKISSRRSSIRSFTGSTKNQESGSVSRHSSLLVRRNKDDKDSDTLSRTKSEKPRSRSPSVNKIRRPSSHAALINACHPILSALCVSNTNGNEDKNSNSNDSGVQDSPPVSDNKRKESIL